MKIPKIPLNRTPNLLFAPQKKKYKLEWQMSSLRSFYLVSLRHFVHFSSYVFRSNMSQYYNNLHLGEYSLPLGDKKHNL